MLNKGEYGKLIAAYLRGELGALEHVHPQLVALLFAEDRKEHKGLLESWLAEGNLVIMDRYVNSNIAFQCAKTSSAAAKEELKQWIYDFEFGHNKLPRPDLSIFLNVPFQQIEKSLNAAREGADRDYLNGKTDIHEDSLELQRNVNQEYQNLLQEQENFYAIDCFGADGQWTPKLEIHQAIWDKIQELDQTILHPTPLD